MKSKFYSIIVLFLTAFSALYACTGNCYEPIAVPGDNVNYFQGMEVSLDGSASYDPDNPETVLTYSWSAPTGINLSGSDTATPSFIAPIFNSGSYYCSNNSYSSEEDCLAANEADTLPDIGVPNNLLFTNAIFKTLQHLLFLMVSLMMFLLVYSLLLNY